MRTGAILPFQIDGRQLASSNRLFAPMAVGTLPTAISGTGTSVAIDATAVPGLELLATFLPVQPVAGGFRRIAARQVVTATVAIAFDLVLPFCWMASVRRSDDIAPNQMTRAYSGGSDQFEMPFGDLVVKHDEGGWQLPHYDAGQYKVHVGFGLGRAMVSWGYSVFCQPARTVPLDAGAYELVRSDDQGNIGDRVADSLESWPLPLGARYSLVFDQSGVAHPTKESPLLR